MGIKGTFMTLAMHQQYFQDIRLQSDPSIDWTLPEPGPGQHSLEGVVPDLGRKRPWVYDSLVGIQESVYDRRVLTMIAKCKHVHSIQQDVLHRQGTAL
jgi:hypothetical protein